MKECNQRASSEVLLVMKRFGLVVHLRWKRGRPLQSCEEGVVDDRDGRRWHEDGDCRRGGGVESFVLTGGQRVGAVDCERVRRLVRLGQALIILVPESREPCWRPSQ
jgi:hypothetical protein